MAIYSITYDLIKSKDYKKLFEGLKSLPGSYVRPTESQWLIDTSKTSKEIRDHLTAYIDSDDKLFVAQILMPKWASKSIDKNLIEPNKIPTEWLHARSDHN